MIFRLEYCNKASVTARVDIQKGSATPIYTVEGTSEPFVLFYNNDKGDKSGSFRSSGADINIYETTEFNIDELKTSNETEISVKYYINNILNWSGFIIPDFFSETITGGKGVVSMVASDRLGTLKGATLSGLSAKVSNRSLADACLAQTGLSLPLYTMADFTGDGTNIFNSEVLSQRMVDTKGRNVSCYDILSSILEETNSLIVQRNGAWYIVNKLQLEAGSGSLYSSPVTSSAWTENTVSFDEVSVGARRTIIPVAATVGVYHEHGGGRLHPDNYDFSQDVAGSTTVTGWTAVNEFSAVVENRSIDGYVLKTDPIRSEPVYGEETTKNTIRNLNPTPGFDPDYNTVPYLKSYDIPVISVNDEVVDVTVDISAIGPHNGLLRYVVLATKGSTVLYLSPSGVFDTFVPTNEDHVLFLSFGQPGVDVASSKSRSITGKLNSPVGYSISIRIYGSNAVSPSFINFASVSFKNAENTPKGEIYKTTQGANYTKDHDIPTVLWGDYLTSGLNGYFYSYPIDDTSSLYRPSGDLHSRWTAYGDADTLPLLQHITRQKARMFSVAHDLLSADIATSTFDPLSIFVDCDSTRYVVVSARFDFLRSNVSVELEEIAYVTNSKRDYIYSYFGDGEEGISSIGGISGGVGSGGGVTHTHTNKAVIDQLTQPNIDVLSYLSLHQTGVETVPVLDDLGQPVLDVNGDPVTEQIPVYAIKSTASFFSEKEVSAYGLGDDGSGGGGSYDMLLSWTNYSAETEQWVISAALAKDMLDRIVVLEAGGGGGGSNVTWGTESGGYASLTVEGVSKSIALSTHTHSQYALSTHNHSGVYEPVFSKNDAFNRNFGTTSTTVARGNDSRIVNGQTAYGWGNHASAGYALLTHTHTKAQITDFAHTHLWADITDKPSTFTPSAHTHSASDITSGTFAIARIPTGTTSSTVALGNHLHTGVYEPSFTKNEAFNKDFGTTSGTVAEGNDSRIVNGQTAYSWGNHASAGYALSSALVNYVTLATTQTISGAKTFNSNLTASASVTTPKVIFATAGWSMEQSSTGVLELKYNGVIKQKFLNDGSIAATGELTAYVAGASGYSEFLPLSGGTLTGNLNIGTGVIIGTAAIPLSVRGSTFKYNNSDVLYKGNIGTASLPSIGLSDGWTIEAQTTPSALLIKKNGVIKGTFNA